MQSRLGEGIRWSWQTTGSRAAPLPRRDIFPLPCCPTPRVKCCRPAQQKSGRMRLATGLTNDAVISLHWLAGHKNSSLTRRILPSGALPVTRVFDVSRQCTSGGPMWRSALLMEMSDYSVSSSVGNLASHKKTAVLPTHLRRGAVDRPMLSGETGENEAGSRRKSRKSLCFRSAMTRCSRGIKNCITLLCEV